MTSSLGNWCLGIKLKDNELKRVIINNRKMCISKVKSVHSLINDKCPHRGASMSEGKIKNENLQCPYHGLEFDISGNLVSVPSSLKLPKNCKVEKYNIFENGGFLWTEADNSANYCKQLNDPNWNKIYGQKIVNGNIVDWIMNGSDISDINFVHDFADEENGINNFKVEENERYIECFATFQPKPSSKLTTVLQPVNEIGYEITSRFILPGTTLIHIKLKEPYEFITFTTLTPVTYNTSMISWAFMYPNKGILKLPIFKEKFRQSIYKTIMQEEHIIEMLEKVPYTFNVESNAFQIAILKALDENIFKNL